MLTTSDIMSGKIICQLGLSDPETVRKHLRLISLDPQAGMDLTNRLTRASALHPQAIDLVRHRTALYEHVRREAIYVRLLEKGTTVRRETVAKLLAGLERSAFRRRLGEVLVRKGSIKPAYDAELIQKQQKLLLKDNVRIIGRYKKEDFAGVARPLIPGSKLEPADFKISTLFRSKQTRMLVDQAEIAMLRAEAARAALRGPEMAEEDKTMIMDSPLEDPETAGTVKLGTDSDVAAVKAELERNKARGSRTTDVQPVEVAPANDGSLASMDDVSKLKRIADYSIIEVLGVGGMGAVFLGQKDGAGEFVAIKVMLNTAAGEEERGRFTREIELTQRILHPRVIGIIETGQTKQGLTYVVVPALAGKELRDLLDQAGNGLPPDLALTIFVQLLEGLDAVHSAGVVHRDLKPENVFVRAGGQHEIKLMDFGLAKPADDDTGKEIQVFRTMASEMSGSPAYIAPESISNDPIDQRTDIYSLGVMLFEILTGRLPLESETSSGYLTQHLICPPLTLAEAKPELDWPPELEQLVEKMLGKSRDERPSGCQEIIELLGGGLAGKIREIKSHATEEEPAEPPEVERTLIMDSPEDQKAWGFKGLLGRLWGKGED